MRIVQGIKILFKKIQPILKLSVFINIKIIDLFPLGFFWIGTWGTSLSFLMFLKMYKNGWFFGQYGQNTKYLTVGMSEHLHIAICCWLMEAPLSNMYSPF